MDSRKSNVQRNQKVKVSYQIIHFTKFCQLSEGMNNLSEEVLSFYLELWTVVREASMNALTKVQDDAEATTKIMAGDEEVDVISN